MKILVDTDVLLDVALNRTLFVDESIQVLRWAEKSGNAAVAWHTLTNCSYLLKQDGRLFLTKLMKIVQVATVGHDAAQMALNIDLPDLEDAFQVAAAHAWQAQYIVTRNLKHYKRSPIKALSPTKFNQMVYNS